jgi:ABC-type hemin transport system substrate-binding protein
MRLVQWLVLAATLLIALACGPGEQIMAGRPPEKVYRTAVSLAPGASEIVIMHNRRLRIIGRTASCDRPEQVLQAPVVMNGVKPNEEMIAKLKPDVILYDGDLYSEADIQRLRDLGFEVMDLGGNSIDQLIDRLYRLAALTRAELLTSEYVDKIHRARSTAQTVAPEPRVRAAVILPGQGGEHMIAGVDGFVADVVRASGAEPVGPGGGLFQTMNAESFMQMDPELIITAGDSTPVLQDPRFSGLQAVRQKNVQMVLQDDILRKGAVLDDLISTISAYVVSAGARRQ